MAVPWIPNSLYCYFLLFPFRFDSLKFVPFWVMHFVYILLWGKKTLKTKKIVCLLGLDTLTFAVSLVASHILLVGEPKSICHCPKPISIRSFRVYCINLPDALYLFLSLCKGIKLLYWLCFSSEVKIIGTGWDFSILLSFPLFLEWC